MQNKINYIVAAVSAAAFVTASYYPPGETFLTTFSAGLFVIPGTFVENLVRKLSKG